MTVPKEETVHCKRCGKKTRWIAGRGGRFSRCEGCGDRFPCAHACAHLDCRDARQEQEPRGEPA